MQKLDRITFEPGKMGGKPCIRGMRVREYDKIYFCNRRSGFGTWQGRDRRIAWTVAQTARTEGDGAKT